MQNFYYLFDSFIVSCKNEEIRQKQAEWFNRFVSSQWTEV